MGTLTIPPTGSLSTALLQTAQEAGTTPVDWIALHLPAKPENSISLPHEETERELSWGRVQKLAYYLGTLAQAGEISPETATLTLQAWNQLHRSIPTLAVPDAAPGPDGQLLLTWNHDAHHFELEIFPTEPAEFFYFNRTTEETWEATYTIGANLPEGVQNRLCLFIQNP